jgi:hypothetical protein
VIPREADLIDTIVDQMHLGIQYQIDMFSTKDITLAEGRRFFVMIVIDLTRQGLMVFGSLGVVDLRGSHDIVDSYSPSGVKPAGDNNCDCRRQTLDIEGNFIKLRIVGRREGDWNLQSIQRIKIHGSDRDNKR